MPISDWVNILVQQSSHKGIFKLPMHKVIKNEITTLQTLQKLSSICMVFTYIYDWQHMHTTELKNILIGPAA